MHTINKEPGIKNAIAEIMERNKPESIPMIDNGSGAETVEVMIEVERLHNGLNYIGIPVQVSVTYSYDAQDGCLELGEPEYGAIVEDVADVIGYGLAFRAGEVVKLDSHEANDARAAAGRIL